METEIRNRPQSETYPYDIFQVGDRAHMLFYTDIEPCTVVETRRGGLEVVVRTDNAELAAGERPAIIPGGFSGHCTNQGELKWDIAEDPSGQLSTFTLRKWRGRYVWTQKGSQPDGHQRLATGWRKFHDYNF